MRPGQSSYDYKDSFNNDENSRFRVGLFHDWLLQTVITDEIEEFSAKPKEAYIDKLFNRSNLVLSIQKGMSSITIYQYKGGSLKKVMYKTS